MSTIEHAASTEPPRRCPIAECYEHDGEVCARGHMRANECPHLRAGLIGGRIVRWRVHPTTAATLRSHAAAAKALGGWPARDYGLDGFSLLAAGLERGEHEIAEDPDQKTYRILVERGSESMALEIADSKESLCGAVRVVMEAL